MWCPECNISSPCDCFDSKRSEWKTLPPDNSEERLRKWEEWFLADDNIN